MYENLISRMETVCQTDDIEDLKALLKQAIDVIRMFEFNESRCPMELSEAIKILNPETTRIALMGITLSNHNRKEAKRAAVDDACKTACIAMSHIIMNSGR